MSVVEVKIGSRNFQLACEDGQEESLRDLASKIDDRFELLAKQMRTHNDSLLLLMTALMAEDELQECQKKLKSGVTDADYVEKKEQEMAEVINTVSGYVESIIDKIEKKKAA